MATLQARLEALATSIRTKINAIMPRLQPPGGTTGQVLAKTSASDYASAWTTNSETYSTITSKLAGGSGGGTTNFLRADGTFAAPEGGGGGAPAGWTQIAASGTLSGTMYSFSNIPTTYSDLLIVVDGMSHNNGTATTFVLKLSNGTQTTTNGCNLTSSGANGNIYKGAIFIPKYNNTTGMLLVSVALRQNTSDITAGSNTGFGWWITNGFNTIQMYPSAGSFDAGTLTLYGR